MIELAVPGVDETVHRMKEEVLRDILSRHAHLRARSFAELHDQSDANEYGGFCEDELSDQWIEHFGGRDEHEGMPEAYLAFMNECQRQVDAWIRGGGLQPAKRAVVVAHRRWAQGTSAPCPICTKRTRR